MKKFNDEELSRVLGELDTFGLKVSGAFGVVAPGRACLVQAAENCYITDEQSKDRNHAMDWFDRHRFGFMTADSLLHALYRKGYCIMP